MTSIDARIWDRFAQDNPYYHTLNWESFRNRERLVAADYWKTGEALIETLLGFAEVQQTNRLQALEIGCGIGRLTLPLARRFRSVTGIDISEEMLRVAGQEVTRASLKNVQLVHGDGRSLSGVPSESVDLVLSYVVFQHLSRRQYVCDYLNEASRVLRPGGCLLFQCPTWVFQSRTKQMAIATAGALQWIRSPRRAYWSVRSSLEASRRLRMLAEEVGDVGDRTRAAEEVRAARLHPSRKMKSIYLRRLLNWLEDAAFVDVRLDRPPGVHTCFTARRL